MVTLHKIAPRLEFRSHAVSNKLKAVCEDVLTEFTNLPRRRLLCYFDDQNPDWLQEQFGQFAAMHVPFFYGGGIWPEYVEKHFWDYSKGEFAFDDLIYVPWTAYAQERVSFVIIFAHELQHFVQWGNLPKVSQANTLLFQNLGSFEPSVSIKPWGLPSNFEAMIVAKRVAESVCGVNDVKSFIQAQINDGKKNNNISKMQLWQWVSTLTPNTSLDLLKETDKLVRRYKQQLQNLKSGIDFSNSNWWL